MATSTIILRANTDQAQGSLEELGTEFTEVGTDAAKAAAKAD